MTLDVVFEDDWLLVADKPSGMLVHRGLGRAEVVLVDLVREHTNETARPIHRLDRGTSGLVAFAKSAEVAAAMQDALRAERVEKRYLALVRGVCPAAGRIDHPVPCEEGGARVAAVTDFEHVETFEAEPRHLSLVRAYPRTGRFHQIRRHLKHIGHPLIGDANYGKGELNRAIRAAYGLDRLALHAEVLRFAHPVTGGELELVAPLPPSLSEPLARMRH